MRIERLVKEEGVVVKWVHFPLHPETPPQGRTLEELFAGRDLDIPAMQVQMRARMQSEGLEYGNRTHTYNSRLAQELASWAELQPGGDAIHDALFRAYFVKARNLGDIDVLVDAAVSVGLCETQVRQALDTRSGREAVDADWQQSRQMGVTGVPTFVAGGQGVVGAQPYDTLQLLVRQAREKSFDT